MIAKPEHSAKQALAVAATIVPSSIDFGRETCCSLDAARDREWLVTNGIGEFASRTVAELLRAWTATAAASATARTKTPTQGTEEQTERARRGKDIKINDARVQT